MGGRRIESMCPIRRRPELTLGRIRFLQALSDGLMITGLQPRVCQVLLRSCVSLWTTSDVGVYPTHRCATGMLDQQHPPSEYPPLGTGHQKTSRKQDVQAFQHSLRIPPDPKGNSARFRTVIPLHAEWPFQWMSMDNSAHSEGPVGAKRRRRPAILESCGMGG